MREALHGGFADSRILEIHGKRMVDHAFAPGGKCTTQRKDLDQALSLAKALGMELPATALKERSGVRMYLDADAFSLYREACGR